MMGTFVCSHSDKIVHNLHGKRWKSMRGNRTAGCLADGLFFLPPLFAKRGEEKKYPSLYAPWSSTRVIKAGSFVWHTTTDAPLLLVAEGEKSDGMGGKGEKEYSRSLLRPTQRTHSTDTYTNKQTQTHYTTDPKC